MTPIQSLEVEKQYTFLGSFSVLSCKERLQFSVEDDKILRWQEPICRFHQRDHVHPRYMESTDAVVNM